MSGRLIRNPYAFIFEQNGQIVINTSAQLRMTLSNENRELVDYLIGSETLEVATLRRFLSVDRINELVRKRVLLPEPLPIEGRYSRQLGFLSFIAQRPEDAQQRLSDAHVLILGAGALGSHVLWNLAAIGVGHITVVDFDTVDISNLNRQLMYWPDDVGQSKVELLCRRIQAFNPLITVTPINMRVTSAEDIEQLIGDKGLVVKAIDTPIESNDWVNAACVRKAVPYITGGFLDNTGVVGPLYIPGVSDHCLACLDEPPATRLAGTGPTFAPLTTIVSSMVSMQAFKILIGMGESIKDRVLTYDVLENRWNTITMRSIKACALCGKGPSPIAASVADNRTSRLIAFRSGIAAVTAFASLLRVLTGSLSVSVLMFVVLLCSTAMLRTICPSPRALNRELFNLAVIYTFIATLTLLVINGGTPTAAGFTASVDVVGRMQGYVSLVIQSCVTATVLFFLLVLTQSGINYVAKNLTRQPHAI